MEMAASSFLASHPTALPCCLPRASPLLSNSNRGRDRVRVRAKSSPENEDSSSDIFDASSENPDHTQEAQTWMSRRQWMTCMCSSAALINNAYTFVSVPKALALDKTRGAVCRNCLGSGAVLCEWKMESSQPKTS